MGKSKDAMAYMPCRCEELFAFSKDPETGKIKIVVGSYMVSRKQFDTFEQAENYVASKPYELVINTACLFMHFNKLEENENKK